MHFHFIKQVIGSVLVEGDILSRIASNGQLAKFIRQLLKAKVILAVLLDLSSNTKRFSYHQ